MIIFGFRTTQKQLAMLTMVCALCGTTAAQSLIKRVTKFSLFFIPLFPVKPAKHFLQCTYCGQARSITGTEEAQLTA